MHQKQGLRLKPLEAKPTLPGLMSYQKGPSFPLTRATDHRMTVVC